MTPPIENDPLADNIWRRYNAPPGATSESVASGVLARAADFGTDRLPLLTDVRRRWPTAVSRLRSDRSSLVHAWFHEGSPSVEKSPPRIVSGRSTRSVGERRTAATIPGVQTKADPVMRPRSRATLSTGSAKIMPPSIDPDGSTFSSLPAAEEPRLSTSGDKARSGGTLRKPPGPRTTAKSAESGLPAQQLQAPSGSNGVGAPLVNRKAAKEPPVDRAAETKTGRGGQQTGQRDSVDKILPKPGYQNSDLVSLSPFGKVTTAGQNAIGPGKKTSPQAGPTSSTTIPSKTSVQRQPIPASNQVQSQATGTGARPHVFRNQGLKTDKAPAAHPGPDRQSKVAPIAPERIRRSPTEDPGGKTDDLPGGTRAVLGPGPPQAPAGASSADHPFAARRPGGSGVSGSGLTGDPSDGLRSAALQEQASPMPGSVGEQLGAGKKDLSGSAILALDPVTASTGRQPALMPQEGMGFRSIISAVQRSGADQPAEPLFLKADPGHGMLIAGRWPHAAAAHRKAPSCESLEAFESQGNSGGPERIFTAFSDGGDLPANESPALDAAKYANTSPRFEVQLREQVLRRTIQKSGSGFQVRRHADPIFPARFPTITHQNAMGGGSEPNPTAGVYRWPSTLSQATSDLIHLAAADGTQTASASDSQSSSTSAASTMDEGPAPETTPGSESTDIERLADEVYDIIERRLIIERERLGQ